MRSGNPALNEKSFQGFAVYEPSAAMTIQGTVTKTALLLAVVVAAASVTWNLFLQQNPIVSALMFGGLIVGLITGLITCFKPTWAPITTTIYATAEGLFLGGISAFFETRYPGIAFQAVCLTFGRCSVCCWPIGRG